MIMKIMYEKQHVDFMVIPRLLIMILTVACWLEQANSAVLLLSGGRAWRIVPGTSPEARWFWLPWRPEPEDWQGCAGTPLCCCS